MRTACLKTVKSLKKELLKREKALDWHEALEEAEDRIYETQLREVEDRLEASLQKLLGQEKEVRLEEGFLAKLQWRDFHAVLFENPKRRIGGPDKWTAEIRDQNGFRVGSGCRSDSVLALADAWIEAKERGWA